MGTHVSYNILLGVFPLNDGEEYVPLCFLY